MIQLKAYEGLIRNHRELAAELGVDLAGLTRRQREERLVVAAYGKWGVQMGAHINGQFAIVLLDDATGELFLTRDILGAELLFCYATPDGRLLYGTQIRDLFGQPGFTRKINLPMVQFYLAYNYVPGEETLFEGVYKVKPGGWMKLGDAGLETGAFREVRFEPDESKTVEDWADEITAAMEASFRDICDEDEQPDSFLSGGVDSSYILAKSRARTGFCVAYADPDASEEADARETAAKLGRGFEGIEVTPGDFFATVDEFLLAYEQPSADVAGLSLFCAAKKVREKSTLCFSGEGADEFFAGYSVYSRPWRYRLGPNPAYHGSTYILNPVEQRVFLKNYCDGRSTEAFARSRGAGGLDLDPLNWMLYTELKTYFEGSILFNSTKIARGTGLDIRMPFCDLRVFDIALRMPARFKATEDANKIALRAAAARALPHEVAYRRKLGFPVPVRSWLADPAHNADIRRAFKSATAAEFFNQEVIDELLDAFLEGRFAASPIGLWLRRRQGQLWRYVWTVYTFIRWYELFFVEERG